MNRKATYSFFAAIAAMALSACTKGGETQTTKPTTDEGLTRIESSFSISGEQKEGEAKLLYNGVMGVMNDDRTWRRDPNDNSDERITFSSLSGEGGSIELSDDVAIPTGHYLFTSAAISGGGILKVENDKTTINGGVNSASKDVLFASKEVDVEHTESGDQNVEFNFSHVFAKMRFELYTPKQPVSGGKTLGEFPIANADRLGIYTTANLDLTTGACSDESNLLGEGVSISSDVDYLVIAGKSRLSSEELQIEWEDKSYSGTIPELTLTGGKRTVIRLTLTRPEFQFTAVVTDWQDESVNYDEYPIGQDNIYIPDPAFKSYLLSIYDTDKNKKLSFEEAAEVDEIRCSGKGVRYIVGVERFPNLKYMDCSDNDLQQVADLTNNPLLTYLDLSGSINIEKIKTSGLSKLTYLNTNFCPTDELDTRGMTALTELHCGGGRFGELNLSNCGVLKILDCQNGELTSLDVENCVGLEQMNCSGHKNLSSIKLGTHNNMTKLTAADNSLSTLDLSGCRNNLSALKLDNNALTGLDISNNPYLTTLSVAGNKLTNIDLSKCNELINLDIHGNKLTQLVLFESNDATDKVYCKSLESLVCHNNNITSLSVRNNLMLSELRLYPMTTLTELELNYAELQYIDHINNIYGTDRDAEYIPTATKIKYWGNARFVNSQFKKELVDLYDKDKDGEINHDEGVEIKEIKVITDKIGSVRGIEYFPNLESLIAYGDDKTITEGGEGEIKPGDGLLTSIDLSHNHKLKTLKCYGNFYLSQLNLSQNTALTEVDCHSTSIEKIDVSMLAELTTFDIHNVQYITALDVTKNSKLEDLNFQKCNLTSIDVSKNKALKKMNCKQNKTPFTIYIYKGQDQSGFETDGGDLVKYVEK